MTSYENSDEIQDRTITEHCEECLVKDIKGYCNDCKKFFCKKCIEDHIGHTMVKLENFCEKKKKIILDSVSVLELPNQLEERRNETTKAKEKLDKDHNNLTKEITLKENMVRDNKEDNYEQELRRLEAAITYLVELEEQALTTSLKVACEMAMNTFDIKENIKAEYEIVEISLADEKKRAEEMDKELKKSKEEIEILNYLRGKDGKYEFDDEKWTKFILLNEKISMFETKYCINTTVDKFRAFFSVEDVFDIEKVMERELIDVGQEVKMSEPLKVEKSLMTGDYIRTSLSHNGVLAICVYSGRSYTIQFTDLENGKQVKMEVENTTLVGFYDSMALLLTQEKRLREATVESVFKNPSIEIFKIIEGTHNAYPGTDVSLLQKTRVLYYNTRNDRLFFFNVDTRKDERIFVFQKIWTMGSLTGIDCGIKALFKSENTYNYNTYALNMDDSETKVVKKQYNEFTTVFPSTTNSKNIKDAVFKYDSNLVKGKKKIDTSKLIKFGGYSVVRIYKDIFLAYDYSSKSWVLIRILVP